MQFLPYFIFWIIRQGSNLDPKQDVWEDVKLKSTFSPKKPVPFEPMTHDFLQLLQNYTVHEPNDVQNLNSLINSMGVIDSRPVRSQDNFTVEYFPKMDTPRRANLEPGWGRSLHLDTMHNLQKRETKPDFLKFQATQSARYVKSVVHIETQNFMKPTDVDGTNAKKLTHDQSVPIQTDLAINSGKLARVNHTNSWKHLHTTRRLREPLQLHPTRNLRKPVQLGPTHSLRKPVQLHPIHSIGQLVQMYQSHNMQNPIQVQNNRKPIQFDRAHDVKKLVENDSKHDLRKPVEVDPTHDLRKPVEVDPTHDLRKPVETDPTHDIRKPVEADPTHDLRKPVETDPTHNLRKPVKLSESHDLRWPVIEEPDHDMRNPITEEDLFTSSDADGKLEKVIKEYIQKRSKTNFIDRVHDHLHKLLYEDEFLLSKCTQDNLNRGHPTVRISPEYTSMRSESEYNKIFNESVQACGIPFSQSADGLSKEIESTKWPWMVSLQQYIFNRFWHKCAGSLLNNLWVITAAHCVESRPKWDFLLQLGVTDQGDTQNYVERSVDRISIHPKFNVLNLNHDIALLRMDSTVTFQPNIMPICLPGRPDGIEKKKAVALSWRIATEKSVTDGTSGDKTVPVLTNKDCEVMFSETGSSESIQKSFLCASFLNGRQDACIGDSGGPLAILDNNGRWLLAGLYSWGKTCSNPNQPEVYIRTSGYAEWIENTISCYEENIKLNRMDS